MLAVLIVTTFIEGRARIDTGLFTNYTSQIAPETAGARAAILGTAWVIGTTALMAIPIGVAAAAYLEEFASKKSRFAHFVELNVQNLAAVPAIIYGMLAAAAVVGDRHPPQHRHRRRHRPGPAHPPGRHRLDP